MLIVGAGGHAKEVYEVLRLQHPAAEIAFWDEDSSLPDTILSCPLLRTDAEAAEWLVNHDLRYVLGTGGPRTRRLLAERMGKLGGLPIGCRASSAILGSYGMDIGAGTDVMHRVVVTTHVSVGRGTLLNVGCTLSHEVRVGAFCEVGPGVLLTGGVQVGDETLIGAGAIVLPGIHIGRRVTVGAGAVVTKPVHDGATVMGIPAGPKM